MSLDVLEEVVRKSPHMESISFPHPKWLIIAKEMGAEIASVETHRVLTFETPEQFKKEGFEQNYGVIQQGYMATRGRDLTLSPVEWQLRFGTEKQYLMLLQNHLDIFGFNEEEKSSLILELSKSLSQLEGRQKAILEALNQSPRDIER